jgi:hypothetical protein
MAPQLIEPTTDLVQDISAAEQCSPDEALLRAILRADWDSKRDRWSSDLFKGKGTSVSRLSVQSFAVTVAIFQRDFNQLDGGPVIAVGEISVEKLQAVAICFSDNATILTVVEKPLDTNRGHAEIPQKISRGLAFKIIKALMLRPVIETGGLQLAKVLD